MRASQADGTASVVGIRVAWSIRVVAVVTTSVMMTAGLSGCGVIPEGPPTSSSVPVSGPPSAGVPGSPSVGVPAAAEGPLAVQRVVDGDTVWILRDGVRVKLRLIGIDTPETVDPRKPVQCFGEEASAQAKRLLDGAQVFIEKDPSQDAIDRYGRELVYLWRTDGVFFNLEMITSGYALEYTYDLPYAFQDQFRGAQRAAEDAERGLWAADTCSGDVEQPAG